MSGQWTGQWTVLRSCLLIVFAQLVTHNIWSTHFLRNMPFDTRTLSWQSNDLIWERGSTETLMFSFLVCLIYVLQVKLLQKFAETCKMISVELKPSVIKTQVRIIFFFYKLQLYISCTLKCLHSKIRRTCFSGILESVLSKMIQFP